MTVNSFQENAETYLDEIGNSIKSLVERCGGTLNSNTESLPLELVERQRSLFIHSGIASLLSIAIKDNDRDTIDLFDWILGYHSIAFKNQDDQESQDKFIVSMFTSLNDQLVRFYPDTNDPRFVRFLDLFRLATLTLAGYINPEEFSEIDKFSGPLAERCISRAREERKRNAEKN